MPHIFRVELKQDPKTAQDKANKITLHYTQHYYYEYYMVMLIPLKNNTQDQSRKGPAQV